MPANDSVTAPAEELRKLQNSTSRPFQTFSEATIITPHHSLSRLIWRQGQAAQSPVFSSSRITVEAKRRQMLTAGQAAA
jgi:hypothetical protein